MIILILAAQLSVGAVALTPKDYLDGRTIADAAGKPVVMLTLTGPAAKRIKAEPVTLDGISVVARVAGPVIEIDGQPDFEAAKRLARALSGKDPLPETMDE